MDFKSIKNFLAKIDTNFNGYIEKSEIEEFQKANPYIPLNGIQEGMFIGDPMEGLQIEKSSNIQASPPPNKDEIYQKDNYHIETFQEIKTPKSFEEIEERWLPNVRDARHYDISQLNLTREQLISLSTDSTTIMNDVQKKIINEVTEKMKDPGLGIRALHEKGITGKGVTIAIIDSPISYNSEFADNIVNYTNLTDNKEGSFHGNTVSSVAVGKECGVAPEAKLSYFTAGCCENYIDAISQIIEQNDKLIKAGKSPISVISISSGFDGYDDYNNNKEELFTIIKKAKTAGIAVITNNKELDPERCPIGRNPDKDINSPENATLWRYWTQKSEKGQVALYDYYKEKDKDNILLIPGENRTVAGEHNDYRYEGNDGGDSWTVPYLAGVYALAKQVNPEITYDEFYKIALQTATPAHDAANGDYIGKIINPTQIIEQCKK